MRILGISAYWHDSAAVLVEDGRVIAAVEEERFTRRKHEAEFPVHACKYCISKASGTIDRIAYYRSPYRNLVPQAKQILSNITHIDKTLRHQDSWIKHWFKTFSFKREMKLRLGLDIDVDCIPHPLAHAASAYYPSGFDRALVFVADAIGEMTTTSLYLGEHKRLELVWSLDFPHSLGVLYQTFCQFLGFGQHHDEYKVMALAGRGRDLFQGALDALLISEGVNGYRLNLKYFQHPWGEKPYYNEAFIRLIGHQPRKKGDAFEDWHADLACSLQSSIARVILSFLKARMKRHKIDNLCLAGGLALNSVLNGMLLQSKCFNDIFVQPASHDSGAAWGAALMSCLKHDREPVSERLTSIALGTEYSNDDYERAIKPFQNKVRLNEGKDKWLPAAHLLAEGRIGGWFQGRMEFGPRSLGQRSIIADPRRNDVRERINDIIKEREGFRPLAPSVLLNLAPKYFRIADGQEFPFMLFVVPVRDDVREKIPAVVHDDGTSRIQTVRLDGSPWAELLLTCYEAEGLPMLLNTSFNMREEPIVCCPSDAVRTFTKAGLDFLVMGDWLVVR